MRTLLEKHGVSLRRFAKATNLKLTTAFRLVEDGIYPVRDTNAKDRVEAFLSALRQQDAVTPGLRRGNGFGTRLERPKSAKENPGAFGNASGASPEVPSLNHESQEDSMLLRSENLTQAAKKQFGLVRSPFIDEVNTTADVFNSASTRYVRAALLDAALNHGFIAIVGESGAGKTTLAEELEERIASEGRPVIVIRPYVLAMEDNDSKGRTLKSGQIAEAIIRTLDPSGSPKRTPEARFRQVHELLKNSRAAGYSHLILIEEAHCLPTPTLKHLKRFLELKQGLSRLLGVCLIGQPELKVRLSEQKADVREVVQRCEIIDLPPLDNDLPAYIAHKFERVGVKAADILEGDAFDAIRARLIRIPRGGKASDAVSLCFPLVVNNLLTRAINAAAAAGWPKVDAQVIGGI
ncbi:MAG: AAA family ATPase [Zoogloeaceae bacterium]|jgi:type II secretory pathway predicted ATPase ExeA|nr:AAA family ATPase [Zoogloeaceae bacterium]